MYRKAEEKGGVIELFCKFTYRLLQHSIPNPVTTTKVFFKKLEKVKRQRKPLGREAMIGQIVHLLLTLVAADLKDWRPQLPEREVKYPPENTLINKQVPFVKRIKVYKDG